jgi:N-acyl-D-amino-acid deacylase
MRTCSVLVGFLLLPALPGQPPTKAPRKWPVIGKAVAELKAFDDAVLQFMKERDIPAGTLAVMRSGKLLLSRGYGYADRESTKPIAPDAPMRFASVAKPMTAAAIRKLIADEKLTWDTKAFVLLGVDAPKGRTADPRLKEITIRHLVEHSGGWDVGKAGDPMFQPHTIAKALGVACPPSPDDVVRYMAGQPLQFAPGERKCYCNFGYCVLGRVIEKVTGQNCVAYLRKEVLAPLGITSVEAARSLPRFRNPREPFYSDPHELRSVFDLDNLAPIPAPDGTFCLEMMDGHGGLIGSSVDLVRFLEAYWITGEPRKEGQKGSFTFFGSLPGTLAMVRQREDGLNIAVLFNQRADASGKKYEVIHEKLDRAADSLSKPPSGP